MSEDKASLSKEELSQCPVIGRPRVSKGAVHVTPTTQHDTGSVRSCRPDMTTQSEGKFIKLSSPKDRNRDDDWKKMFYLFPENDGHLRVTESMRRGMTHGPTETQDICWSILSFSDHQGKLQHPSVLCHYFHWKYSDLFTFTYVLLGASCESFAAGPWGWNEVLGSNCLRKRFLTCSVD